MTNNSLKIISQRFSKIKKLETQQKVRKQHKTMLPVVISTMVTFTIFLFIFLTINKQDPELKMSASISSKVEGQDAVNEMMERKLQFQTIIEDEEITAAERVEYLRTSDWKLQLAFEHITNSTYEIPDVTEDAVCDIIILYAPIYAGAS